MRFFGLLLGVLVLGANGLVAAGNPASVTPNILDETGDASASAEWIKGLQASLVNFEATTGITVDVQYHAKSPPDAEDKNPGDYMRALSAKLGLIKHGVLMVHFGDDPDWRIWIGDDLTSKFVGKPGTAKEFTESGAMHDAKEPMLNAAMAKAAKGYAAMGLPAQDPKVPASGSLLRLQTEAIFEGVRAKLSPR